MAILPPLPDPNLPKESHREKSLADRALFLGELGRSDPNQRARTAQEASRKSFERLLDEAQDDEEIQSGSPESPASGNDASVEDVKDAERESRKGGEKEAFRHAGGWRGPNPLLGLGVLPGLLLPQGQPLGQAQPSESRHRADKAASTATDPGSAPVDPAILEQLRHAGLRDPLKGFHDSRIRSDHALLLPTDGWKEDPVPGGRAYHWQEPGGSRFQRLRVTEVEGLLESSAGTLRQVIHKSHGEYSSSLTPQSDTQGFLG